MRTNYEEVGVTLSRPGIINAIAPVVTAPDLKDRTLTVIMRPISPELKALQGEIQRKEEEKLLGDFDCETPTFLGVFYDALAVGLVNVATANLGFAPRLLDFSKWAIACLPVLGYSDSTTFMEAYITNRRSAHETSLETWLIYPIIRKLMQGVQFGAHLENPATSWLKDIMAIIKGNSEFQDMQWDKRLPKHAISLGKQFRKYQSALREHGIRFEAFEASTKQKERMIRLSWTSPPFEQQPQSTNGKVTPEEAAAYAADAVDEDGDW